MAPLRWGFVGAGKISNDFAACLHALPREEHQLVAIGASDLAKAQAFAKLFGFQKSYGSYTEVAADPEIDVVYIGTINPNHYEMCKLMINHKKHILCEKPLTLLLEHTTELIALAEKSKLFFQEAIWTRFFPATKKLCEELKAGTLGTYQLATAQFGFNDPDTARNWKKELGGGSLMDIGTYTIQFALSVFGPEMPETIKAVANLNKEGCDMTMNAILQWKKGGTAQIATTFLAELPSEAYVYGSKGLIKIPHKFWCSDQINIKMMKDGDKDTAETKHKVPLPEVKIPLVYEHGEGMTYEAQEVKKCIDAGLLESPFMPHKDSITIAKIHDEIKKQIGLSYDELYKNGGVKTTKVV